MRHVISVLVRNKPGVLARVAGLFSARGFNIESLNVGETEDPETSRMTVVVPGDDQILEQVRKQLSKLVDTIKVQDFREAPCVTRDLVLVRVKAPAAKRGEIMQIAAAFGAHIVDLAEKAIILEMTAEDDKLDRFLKMLQPYGIGEMARTGRIAMLRTEPGKPA